MSGESGNDTLFGGSGADIVAGGTGNDIITGGAGKDTLTGGANQDRFNYTMKTEGGDHITDFSSQDDTLTFKSSGFGNHAIGILQAGEFQRGTSDTALTADVRFLYETDTGILRYDGDGSGAGAATIIATLDGAPDLYRMDLLII